MQLIFQWYYYNTSIQARILDKAFRMRAHYKHAAIIKVFLFHANTLRGMLRHLCEISTAFDKEDLSVKKIEQRTDYGANRVRRSE